MAGKKKIEQEEELSRAIVEELNKTSKEGNVAFIIGDDETVSDLKDFISTGCARLDLAISNRPNGGIACGRITELTGLEGSGKSLIAAHLMANVQKEGGIAVLIDTEAAVNEQFFEAIGVKIGKAHANPLVYITADSVEAVFEQIEQIIEKVRKGSGSARNKKILIVVDSVTAVGTRAELEGGYSQDGYGTQKPKIIGLSMRKLTLLIAQEKIALVFTNQLRFKMNAQPFSDPYTTSGGKAIAFHASTCIRLASVKKIKSKEDEIIGMEVQADIKKNRLGPPHRKVTFDMYFDRGIDDVTCTLKFLKDKNIITGTAAKYEFVDSEGVVHEFKPSTWSDFVAANPETYSEIYTKMCEAMVMLYRSDGSTTLDDSTVSVEEGTED